MTFTPRKKIAYFYDSDVGNYYYAQGHPMKPHRMRMTHNLLVAYGLFDKIDLLTTPRASDRDMTRFHSDEYINFLKSVTPDSLHDQLHTLCRFNVLEDCPVFDGLWEYCQIAAGGSLAGAERLNSGENNVSINWAGGLHHAKKAEASGFCYINDCVLAILELLKHHARVLYVDIDIHHGDGVEEAFYTTDRVMTASFHKFGDYFPGTGHANDIGIGRGKHYSANFPLRDGIDDESYREIFVPVMTRIMEWYRPGAVVLQCGADSLSGDRLGCFNLSLRGHAQCVDFFRQQDVPLLLLGGGGYTIRNVARCWAYETSRVAGETLSDELPFNENYEFYGPDFRLHITPSNMENHNSRAELEQTKMRIIENLRHLPYAPSTPFIDTPRISPLSVNRRDYDSEDESQDYRLKTRRAKTVVDYAGSDDEDDDQYIISLRHAKKRAKRMNFPRRRFPSTSIGGHISEKGAKVSSTEREDYSPRLGLFSRSKRGEITLGKEIGRSDETTLRQSNVSNETAVGLNGERSQGGQQVGNGEGRDENGGVERLESGGSKHEKNRMENGIENGVVADSGHGKSLGDGSETPSRQDFGNSSNLNNENVVEGMELDRRPEDNVRREFRGRAGYVSGEQISSSLHSRNGEGNTKNMSDEGNGSVEGEDEARKGRMGELKQSEGRGSNEEGEREEEKGTADEKKGRVVSNDEGSEFGEDGEAKRQGEDGDGENETGKKEVGMNDAEASRKVEGARHSNQNERGGSRQDVAPGVDGVR